MSRAVEMSSDVPNQPTRSRRLDLLPRLGLRPSTGEVVGTLIDTHLPAGGAVVLDAGCGRVSALVPFRSRIADFVGVDIHQPESPLPWLDRFVVADVCGEPTAFAPESFDFILSSFTLEHFVDPPAALRNLALWLRPGGTLVATTVNRRHPFVDAYLSLPPGVGRPLQRLVKATAADAHPLVGACNRPADVRQVMTAAGLVDVEVLTTSHLARAWQRRPATWALGLIGDLATRTLPERRSTIVARARRAPQAATGR